jgi:serine O-acetyltransferase
MSAFKTCTQAIAADHAAMRNFGERYNADRVPAGSLLPDLVQRIGFQMLVAVRLMQLGRDLHIPLAGPLMSRLIRHLYGAEIHWEASIAPGISVVHGNGLVISRAATVGPGCLLFQGVTLGESMDPETQQQGAPTLVKDVHVMPNAVLVGPIVVGEGSKVQANVTLSTSVPPFTSVRGPQPEFFTRTGVSAAPITDKDRQ